MAEESGLLDELFVALGFKVDEKKVKEYDDSLKATIGSLKRLITVAAGAVIALDRMTNAMLKTNQAYINFNRQTGLSIDKINSIAGAGMLADYNLTPENIMSSMQALQSNLAAIRIGQGNIAPFQMLGISPVGKDATQVLEELRVALRGVDDAMAVNIIQQMGLSPDMISLLRLTSSQMEQLSAAARKFQLTEKQRQSLNEFAMEMRLIHLEMANLKDRALIAIAPYLIKFLDNFTKILEVLWEYRKVLVFLGIGGVAAILKMNGAIKILGITINATFGKWLAALTAIYLILEDLAVWKMGGQSLIGDLYEWGNRGGNRDLNAKTNDEMFEEIVGKGAKRSRFEKALDFANNILSLGGYLPGSKSTREMYEDMALAKKGEYNIKDSIKFDWNRGMARAQTLWQGAKSAGRWLFGSDSTKSVGNVSANQNMQQTNYLSFSNDGGGMFDAANKVTDLMFTMMQFDRSQ